MRIAILGASGRTGNVVVTRALEQQHEVVAVVRSAARAPVGTTPAVADALDPAGLADAFGGVDAVISCVGHVKGQGDGTLLASSAAAVLEAMSTSRVRRLVVVSASGAFVGGDDPLTRFIAKPLLNRILRENMNDTRAMEAVLRSSDVDWTALRPSQLVDKPGKENYRTRVELSLPWGFQTSYNTVARAALDALTRPDWARHAVSVAD
jgi:putative NADH-flavin reductase